MLKPVFPIAIDFKGNKRSSNGAKIRQGAFPRTLSRQPGRGLPPAHAAAANVIPELNSKVLFGHCCSRSYQLRVWRFCKMPQEFVSGRVMVSLAGKRSMAWYLLIG